MGLWPQCHQPWPWFDCNFLPPLKLAERFQGQPHIEGVLGPQNAFNYSHGPIGYPPGMGALDIPAPTVQMQTWMPLGLEPRSPALQPNSAPVFWGQVQDPQPAFFIAGNHIHVHLCTLCPLLTAASFCNLSSAVRFPHPYFVTVSFQVFPRWSLPKKQPTLLVVCGCEQNGAIGLVCARHLRVFEYEPTIFYPKPSSNPLYRDFITQCEKMDIPFLSYLPNEVSAQLPFDAYNLVVDAMLGVETSPEEVCEPYLSILGSLKQIHIPLISLDIPSGWDVETGNGNGINPDVLISLGAPKQCAMHFMGKHHLVAGRFLPYDVERKFELNLPEYPGTECVAFL
uniref:YjeF N-terminal domain-containing protein n=1 Tax=Varanus komodoensis TaxID=61221 RepID=A0A8D2JBD9_VARKO